MAREVVERAGPALVAAQRELARGGLHRVGCRRTPNVPCVRLARAHEVEAAAHRREAALAGARLEALIRARHLPRLDGAESDGALGGPRLADEEVVHRGGEGVVADGRRGGRRRALRP